MPKAAKVLLPPSPAAVEKLIAAARAATEPATAAVLAKVVSPPDRLSQTAAEEVLEQAVLEKELFRYPSRTARGKPRYWGHDLSGLARAAVDEMISRMEGPVTAKELLKGVSSSLKLTEADILPGLEAAVQRGALFAIPPATPKGKLRYWNRDLSEFGRRSLVALVNKKGPQSPAALLKSLKGFSPGQAEQVLTDLLKRKELWRHPVCGKVKKELMGVQPPSPAPYLKEISSQLCAIVPILLAAGVSSTDLRRSMFDMMEAAGIPGLASAPAMRPASRPADALPGSLVAPDLIALMKRIEPGATRGALVAAAELRRAAGFDKQEFDRAVLELAREQQLTLHRHDYPASLTPAALEDLVFDGISTYYVGMALRVE